MNKWQEIREELKVVFAQDSYRIFDSVAPVLLAVLLNVFLSDWRWKVGILALFSLIVLILRIARHQKVRFLLAGVGLAAFLVALNLINQNEQAVFLPGIITGGVTVLICLVSVVLGKPIAAWSSYLTRRWPLEWYWHAQIKPAYRDVSLFWAVAFGLRLAIETFLFQNNQLTQAGFLKLAIGWPYTLIVLILSYLFGRWRLTTLQGPSVEEFQNDAKPPWVGQQRGF